MSELVRPPLVFEPVEHRYRLGDREVPGITRVLTVAGLIDGSWHNDHARDRGTAVHLATQFGDEGDLDTGTLDPEILPYLDAWGAFREESGIVLTEPPELLVASPTLQFATQVDRIGTMDGATWVLNMKTGTGQKWHHVQTAGEAIAYAEWRGLSATDAVALKRGSVELRANGTYKLHPHDQRIDFARFRAAIVIYQTKEEWK